MGVSTSSLGQNTRSGRREILDGKDFDFDEYERAMKQLTYINRLTRGYAPTLKAIERVAAHHPGRRLRILDVGSGSGDTLRALAKWASRRGIVVELTGLDLDPWAKIVAEKVTPRKLGIRWRTGDVFDQENREDADDGYNHNHDHSHGHDIIISALFTHHLSDEGIVRFLRWMDERARLAWFINDLHRHPVAFHVIKWATRLTGCNRMIKHDAPLSVARGFRTGEWITLLAQAGFDERDVSVQRHWPFRHGILRVKAAVA